MSACSTLSRSPTPNVAEKTPGVGLSDPQLSGGRRRMLDLVNRLHSTGVQVDVDLPQIAVIGSQSAGKSSLIESISGITLPRAAGTCTRCPIECRLSQSESPWQCIVSLRFTTDVSGQPLGQARNERFGEVIKDKGEVEERIRRAQKAVLNPRKPSNRFLSGDEEVASKSELSFSMNCVSLQISGPGVADLSFCDLPGLIASVSEGRKDDVKLVKQLVTSYIKRPSCIILLTVACETDFENQGAHRIAKQYDPTGNRTIGVLTKPDRIPTGEEANWLPFIRNEKEKLENHWFCVKQPSSNELKTAMTWDQVRAKEELYFSSNAPWCELDPNHRKRLGTVNLVQRLSQVLLDLISKKLPQIQAELDKSITATHKALDDLPQRPPDNPQGEVHKLLFEFITDLSTHVMGVPDEDGLLQTIRPAQERFRQAIRATAPNFRPFERKDEETKHIQRADFLVQEEGDVPDEEHSGDEGDMSEKEHSGDEGDMSDKEHSGDKAETSPMDVVSDDEDSDESDEESSDSEDEMPSLKAEAPVQQNSPSRGTKRKSPPTNKIYIDEVMQRANRARTRELPGHFPFVVQKTFIESIIKEWKAPALILSQTIKSSISLLIENLVKKHFSHFGQRELESRVRKIMTRRLQSCIENTKEKIEWQIDLETGVFSLNTHYLSAYKTKFMAYYKAERQRYSKSGLASAVDALRQCAPSNVSKISGKGIIVKTSPQDEVKKIMAGLSGIGMNGLKPDDLLKLLPPDDMDPALEIMSDVRAYFQVAYKRFADAIPLTIDHELVRGVERDAMKILHTGLHIDGKNGYRICSELSQESPQVADTRVDLEKKLERLKSANDELLSVDF